MEMIPINVNSEVKYQLRDKILETYNHIEYVISKLITDYFEPSNEKDLFENIVLNNSVIGMGQKVKILSNLKNFDKKVLEDLRKFNSNRNGAAHTNASEKTDFVLNNGEYEDINYSFPIKVMNSGGQIKERDLGDIYNEQMELYLRLFDYFKIYREENL